MKPKEPRFRVSFRNEPGGPVEVLGGRHFRLDPDCLGKHLKAGLSPRMMDLLRVARSVYMIDRLARRGRSGSSRWARSLRASIEVIDPEFWFREEVRGLFRECVEFVSGDSWDFEFVEGPSPRPAHDGGWLSFDDPPLVCLYSGGLDSAAGLANRLRCRPPQQVIPVLVRHQSAQRRLVDPQLDELRRRYGVDLKPVVAVVRSVAPSRLYEEESSQRCRSLLFTVTGGVVAWMSGATSVEIFESGIGAINLPLMSGMLGSRATKGSHPRFLRLMSRLVSLAAGREITFRLPFIDRTKAEVVRTLADDGLSEVARITASCVHYPLRDVARKQCGACPACIFRRQAMMTAGIEEPGDAYKYDLFGPAEIVNRVAVGRRSYLKAFLMQVEHLSELDAGPAVPRSFKRHLVGTGVVARGESLSPYVDLFRRYRDEWLAIVARGRAEGWVWADLLAPVESPVG